MGVRRHRKHRSEDLAERIEGTIRDANCKRCEMRAIDAEDRVIDHFMFRADPAVLAQVVSPAGGLAIPFEITESLTASLKTHRAFAALGLKGIAENQEHTKDIIADLRKQNSVLLEALTQTRQDRTEEIATVRAENGGEIKSLRKENAELRERISNQWQMEDELRSKHVDKQMELEKSRVFGRIAEATLTAGVAQFFPRGSPGARNVRQQLAEKFLDSITKEQANAVLPLLSDEQQALLASFLRIGAEASAKEERNSAPTHDASVAAAKANVAT